MIVRDATPDDAAAIGRAHAEAWRVAYDGLFAAEWLESAVAERLQRWTVALPHLLEGAGEVLVVEVGGAVVGFLHAGAADDGAVGVVFGLYVHPDNWGSGAGTMLLSEGVGRLHAAGFDRVVLWTMKAAHQARTFYEHRGWEVTDATLMHDFGAGQERLLVQYAFG